MRNSRPGAHLLYLKCERFREPAHVLKPESSLRGTLDSLELSAKPAAAEVFKMSRRVRRPENSRFA
ncbi:MAG TPA: hypothetical protein VFV61_00025 [Pyrinomonadaceae bacterium]|nr:hypothetical protein [Pyrinomonadaceae bacterium]